MLNSLPSNRRSSGGRRQGIFWLLTIPFEDFTPFLPEGVAWIKGQHEIGDGGFSHWQIITAFSSKKSLAQVKAVFGARCHAELSRSELAEDYVWKESTRVENSQFSLGAKPIRRNSVTDWESVWYIVIKLEGPPPSPEYWKKSLPMYAWYLIGPYAPLKRTMTSLWPWLESLPYFGVEQVLESRIEQHLKLVHMLTIRIQDPSSGVVTNLNQIVLSMNFVELSTSLISLDGSTDIHYMWKQKGHQLRTVLPTTGSLPTSIPLDGTQN